MPYSVIEPQWVDIVSGFFLINGAHRILSALVTGVEKHLVTHFSSPMGTELNFVHLNSWGLFRNKMYCGVVKHFNSVIIYEMSWDCMVLCNRGQRAILREHWGWEIIYSHGAGTFCLIRYMLRNRHRNEVGQCVSSWSPLIWLRY